nr:ParB/RepB/Spo0J family partition protein [Actinomycetales bacterium]
MAEKRRGLGRGIGALIPSIEDRERPSDIFFPPRSVTPSGNAPGSPSSRGEASPPPMDSTTVEQREARPETAWSNGGTLAGPESVSVGARESSAFNGVSDSNGAPGSNGGLAAANAGTLSTPPLAAVTTEAANAAPARTATASPAQDRANDGLRPVPGVRVAELPVEEITPNPRQPREVFDEEYLEELASSISEVGLLQPIVVRPAPAGSTAPWELIMGEHRLRASALAGLETIPAVIRETEDADLLRDALLENLHRADLNPLEEASAYQQLLEDFGCTQEELARRVARSRPQISNTLRLLKLPPLVQRRVAAGVLSAGHARALLGLEDGGAMERLAQRIVAEGLSVRATEEIVALGEAPLEPEMRRRPREASNRAEMDELATRLADRFDTRVKVTMGARRGRITVDFASVEDLGRILEVLAPGESVPGSEYAQQA